MQEEDAPAGERNALSSPPSPPSPMTAALDVLSILKDSRLTVIEADPTDVMVAAGVAISGASTAQVRAVFRAMIAASVEPPHRTQ
jgi:hypothetical protein